VRVLICAPICGSGSSPLIFSLKSFFQHRLIFLGLYQGQHLTFVGCILRGFFVTLATGLFNRLQLRRQNLIAGNAGARHHHNEGNIRIARRHHGRNDPSFAVADQANPVRIDLGTRLQIGNSSLCVGSKVRRGGGCEVPGGLARAPSSARSTAISLRVR